MFSNAKTSIPLLFKEIIDIDRRIDVEKDRQVVNYNILVDLTARRFELTKAAEKFIQTKRKEST